MTFNQEKALVGAFSMIVQPVVDCGTDGALVVSIVAAGWLVVAPAEYSQLRSVGPFPHQHQQQPLLCDNGRDISCPVVS